MELQRTHYSSRVIDIEKIDFWIGEEGSYNQTWVASAWWPDEKRIEHRC